MMAFFSPVERGQLSLQPLKQPDVAEKLTHRSRAQRSVDQSANDTVNQRKAFMSTSSFMLKNTGGQVIGQTSAFVISLGSKRKKKKFHENFSHAIEKGFTFYLKILPLT